jgi:transposase
VCFNKLSVIGKVLFEASFTKQERANIPFLLFLLLKKARSLGYVAVDVNELYTSQRCPVCKNFVGPVDMRRKFCVRCRTYLHRDTMAAHNMCNVLHRREGRSPLNGADRSQQQQ